MTTSASASSLLSAATQTPGLTKPAAKPEDKEHADKSARAREHKDKDYRAKELRQKERVKEHAHAEKVSKAETNTHEFEDELETASTLATPIVASVVVSPAPDLMNSQISVSLLPATTTTDDVTVTAAATTQAAAAASTATTTTDDADVVTTTAASTTSETPETVVTTTTTSTTTTASTDDASTATTATAQASAEAAANAEPITLSAAQMKQVIDALNRTDTLTQAGIRIVPSEANKVAIQTALKNDPNLLSNPDAIEALITSIDTKPANGLAKGIDIRLSKTNELNIYAMADAPAADAPDAAPNAGTSAHVAHTADDDTTTVSADSTTTSDTSFKTSLDMNGAPHLKVIDGGLAPTVTPVSTNASPVASAAASAHSAASLPASASQAVASVIDKFVKDDKTGVQSISLRLDPAELGRMDVRMEYKKGDPLKVHLVVEKADTLNMFLRDQKSLEAALGQAGIDSANVSLSFEHNQNAFEHAMNQESGHDGSDTSAQASVRSDLMTEMDDLVHAHMDMYIDASGLTRYNMKV